MVTKNVQSSVSLKKFIRILSIRLLFGWHYIYKNFLQQYTGLKKLILYKYRNFITKKCIAH